MDTNETPADRLEYIRAEIRAERVSWGELAELASLAEHIAPGDVELLEWAGVPEFPECDRPPYAADDDPHYVVVCTDDDGSVWVQAPEVGHYYGRAEAEAARLEITTGPYHCTAEVAPFYTPGV